jgi:hypothetical protein
MSSTGEKQKEGFHQPGRVIFGSPLQRLKVEGGKVGEEGEE